MLGKTCLLCSSEVFGKWIEAWEWVFLKTSELHDWQVLPSIPKEMEIQWQHDLRCVMVVLLPPFCFEGQACTACMVDEINSARDFGFGKVSLAKTSNFSRHLKSLTHPLP